MDLEGDYDEWSARGHPSMRVSSGNTTNLLSVFENQKKQGSTGGGSYPGAAHQGRGDRRVKVVHEEIKEEEHCQPLDAAQVRELLLERLFELTKINLEYDAMCQEASDTRDKDMINEITALEKYSILRPKGKESSKRSLAGKEPVNDPEQMKWNAKFKEQEAIIRARDKTIRELRRELQAWEQRLQEYDHQQKRRGTQFNMSLNLDSMVDLNVDYAMTKKEEKAVQTDGDCQDTHEDDRKLILAQEELEIRKQYAKVIEKTMMDLNADIATLKGKYQEK